MKQTYQTGNGRITLDRRPVKAGMVCPCCGRPATVRLVYRDRYGAEANNLCDRAAADVEGKVKEQAR